jgi:transcriptional regulator with XRE-family HTH domain
MLSYPVGEVKEKNYTVPKNLPNPVCDAVRKLRLALGDTQQSFASRLGLAISTVVRYELTRPPKGKALAQFAELAKGLRDAELADVFRRALVAELEFDPFRYRGRVHLERHWAYLMQRAEGQEEQRYVLGFYNAMTGLHSKDAAVQEASRAALKEFTAKMEGKP